MTEVEHKGHIGKSYPVSHFYERNMEHILSALDTIVFVILVLQSIYVAIVHKIWQSYCVGNLTKG